MKTTKEIAADCGLNSLQAAQLEGWMTAAEWSIEEAPFIQTIVALYRRIETLEAIDNDPLVAVNLAAHQLVMAEARVMEETLPANWDTNIGDILDAAHEYVHQVVDRALDRKGDVPHKFEVHESEDPTNQSIWCKHCNKTRDEVPGLHIEN